jgi:hypothetical protein
VVRGTTSRLAELQFRGDNRAVADEPLVPVFIPSLVAILRRAEVEHGSPLTREQVLAVRDACNVVMLPPGQAAMMAEQRGYDDIDPVLAWEQWQEIRQDFERQAGSDWT